MKKLLLLITCSVFLLLFSKAQNEGTVKGHIIDSSGNQKISDATVSLVNAKDSALVAFTRTDTAGNFSFSKLKKGNYRISVSHVNFHTLWRDFIVDPSKGSTELGDLNMMDKSVLQTISIKAQRAPVVVNGDTLEFNSEAFKTKPNAVVEDLLKKMPGVEVDKNGRITVNGKPVARVLVNGKDFFNGDPTIATRNLSADEIDKVQVFDKLSDQSAFTGVDDGNSQKTLNLKLKKDKANALFGKASADAGTDNRYESKFNLNKFRGDKQLSALGMSNNINQQGFSFMDVMNFTGENKKMMRGGGGIVINTSGPQTGGVPVAGQNGNSQGITQITAGGINYSDLFNKKTDLNTSYFYNNLSTRNEQSIFRQNLLQGNNFNYSENNKTNSATISNRLNFTIDQQLDSFNSIKLNSSVATQIGSSYFNSNYNSINQNKDTLNSGNASNASTSNGVNIINDLLLKHKFAKKGRTISLNAVQQYNNSILNTTSNSVSNFYSGNAVFRKDTIDQNNYLKSVTQSFGSNITYTEPLSKKALLEFRSFYNYGMGDLERNTYELNKSNGKHDVRNMQLSNNFNNTYSTLGGGVTFRGLNKKFNYSAGVNIENDRLKSQIKDNTFSVKHSTNNILPLVSVTYNMSKTKNLRLDYNTSITQPTSSQLQPIKDISDPLNVRVGNPDLLQSYTNTINLQYFSANIGKQSNLIAFLNYGYTNNAIVNSETISNVGQRVIKPVNIDGLYNIFGVLEKGFKVKAISTRFSLGINTMYNKSANFINDQLEKTTNFSYTPKIGLNYTYKELLDFNFTTRLNFNKVKYSLENSLNNNYLKQQYNADATLTLPKGLTFNSDITYTVNKGRTDGFNQNTTMLNAAIAKQVFKSKKGELKFSVYNLLNQNVGIDRNENFNYIQDSRYLTIKRYITLGFTYSLQKPSKGGPRMVMRTF